MTILTTLTPARKTGRCVTGAERGGGRRIHAIGQVDRERALLNGGSWAKALCGAEPGRNSPGWEPEPTETRITCPACQARIANINSRSGPRNR